MVSMLTWLDQWLQNDDTKIIYFLCAILIANMIDFLIGFINAKFNKKVDFASSKAIYGIARKMVLFMVVVFFVPVTILIVPKEVALPALYILLGGYLLSEINSILSHLKLANDDKSVDTFIDFVNRILKGGK